MAKKISGESKLFAFLAYFLVLVGFIIVLLAKKKDAFAMYHAKQSLVLTITAVIVHVSGTYIPIIGWFIIWPIGVIFVAICWIIGIIRAIIGNKKPLPIIGKYGERLKL